MRRARSAAVILIVILVGACSNGGGDPDTVGSCEVGPGVVCRDQDLRNVSLIAADLRGVDLSGSDLSSADLRGADLTGAKLIGTQLASTNLAGAILKNADLTRAFLFSTNLTDADLSGAVTEGAQQCNVIDPDGALTSGSILGPDGKPVQCGPQNPTTTRGTTRAAAGAPVIEYFRPALPKRCLNDAGGTGIEVEWSAPDANTLAFLVDGIRIGSSNKARGTQRLPFVCDGKKHLVSIQVFGAIPPEASGAFSVALRPTAPLTNND